MLLLLLPIAWACGSKTKCGSSDLPGKNRPPIIAALDSFRTALHKDDTGAVLRFCSFPLHDSGFRITRRAEDPAPPPASREEVGRRFDAYFPPGLSERLDSINTTRLLYTGRDTLRESPHWLPEHFEARLSGDTLRITYAKSDGFEGYGTEAWHYGFRYNGARLQLVSVHHTIQGFERPPVLEVCPPGPSARISPQTPKLRGQRRRGAQRLF